MRIGRRLYTVAPGNAGILQTVDRMRDLVGRAVSRPEIQAIAVAIARTTRYSRPSDSFLAHAIYRWVQKHMIYTPDEPPIEDNVTSVAGEPIDDRLRDPVYLIQWIQRDGMARGDCDDFVMLLSALWAAVGIESQWVLVSAAPDGEFDHIYAEVRTEDGWLPADAIHGRPLGWSVPQESVTNRLVVNL